MKIDEIPANCTTCKFHTCHYDSHGFDGCTCSHPAVKIGTYHKYCHEFCDFGFNPEKDDGDCLYYVPAE